MRAAGGSTDSLQEGMAVKRASHCVYDTRYHLVWAPKYRKWVLQGAIRQRVKDLFQEIAAHHGFEIEELEVDEVDKDHVHLFLSFPPRYSIGKVEGCSRRSVRRRFGGNILRCASSCGGGSFGKMAISSGRWGIR